MNELKPDPLQTRQVQEFKHPSPLLGCRFDPSGRFVFAGAQDNGILRWELANSKKTALAGHQSWVRALAFLPQEKRLVSGDYHGRLLWWDAEAETPTPVRTVEAHDGWLRAIAISPDGKLIATCGNDRLIKLWTSDNGQPLRTLAGHATHVYNVAFHPDGKQLASVDHRGVVKHWDLAKGTAERDLDAGVLSKRDPVFRAHIGGARSVAFNAAGTRFACAGITNVSNAYAGIGNPAIVLFDWTNGKQLPLLKPKEAFQGTMWGVAYHPAGFWIGVAGGSGGALWFWKDDQPASFHTFKLSNNGRDLSLHPDGARLAVPHADGSIRILDMSARAAEAKDGDNIEGTWLPATAELGGKMFPDEVRKTVKLVVKDGKYTATVGKQVDQGTVKLNPAAKPKQLDITGTDGPNKGKTILAIYERNGDTLRICYDLSGKSRPTEFKSKEGTQLFLVTYQRQR